MADKQLQKTPEQLEQEAAKKKALLQQFAVIKKECEEHKEFPQGRPIALTPEMYGSILAYLQNGADREEAVRASQMGITSFYRYLGWSPTFRKAVELSEDFPNTKAQMVVVGAIDKGDVDASQWWLERVKKKKFSKSPDIQVNNNNLMMVSGKKVDLIDDIMGDLEQIDEAR